MIKIRREYSQVEITNNTLYMVVDYSNGIRIRELSNVFSGSKANKDQELFTMEIFGRSIRGSEFVCEEVALAQDDMMDLATFHLEYPEEAIQFRIHVIDSKDDSLRVLYQCYDAYREGVPSIIFFHIPFLANLESGGEHDVKYYPCNSVRDKKGNDVLHRVNESFYSSDIIMPFVVCDERTNHGFSVSFPVPSDLSDLGSVQNVNYQISRIAIEEELQNHSVRLNPDASFNDTAELVITGLKDGWAEAFDRYRDSWKSAYDFSQYERADLKWFRECAVHNFTFLYGKEGFDHKAQKIDVDRLLAEGDEFGGFDTVILWNQYPRLGIDERTQWDFYDDFPGGRAAIREAVDKFHEHGVKVLLPFIPWDRHEDEGTDSMGSELARIAKDTDLDGFHLDTMKTFALSAREKLDEVKPGIVLETQGHPMKKHSMELVTTSWDEFWSVDPMPEIDVLRFIHPQHVAPVIGRWLRMQDKDTLIKRAEFGGVSIVVWQDIFGRWMPYTAEQKKRIRNWKNIYLNYLDIYLGMRPIPLYQTHTENVFCNVFTDDENIKQIYSFYNDGESDKTVRELELWRFDAENAETILGDGIVKLDDGRLTVMVPAKEVVHILVSKR